MEPIVIDIFNMQAELDLDRPRQAHLRAIVGGHRLRGVTARTLPELRAKVLALRPAQIINHLHECPPTAA